MLLRNEGTSPTGVPIFSDCGMAAGVDDIRDGRGMAFADFDNDGDLDIVVNNNPGDCGKPSVPPMLLKNNVGQHRHWLVMHLVGTKSNRDAVGAEVRIYSGKFQAMRHVHIGSGYASQGDLRLYFGLGDNELIERISVKWPSGAVQEFRDVASNQLLMLVEGNLLEVAPYVRPTEMKQTRVDPGDSSAR